MRRENVGLKRPLPRRLRALRWTAAPASLANVDGPRPSGDPRRPSPVPGSTDEVGCCGTRQPKSDVKGGAAKSRLLNPEVLSVEHCLGYRECAASQALLH